MQRIGKATNGDSHLEMVGNSNRDSAFSSEKFTDALQTESIYSYVSPFFMTTRIPRFGRFLKWYGIPIHVPSRRRTAEGIAGDALEMVRESRYPLRWSAINAQRVCFTGLGGR